MNTARSVLLDTNVVVAHLRNDPDLTAFESRTCDSRALGGRPFRGGSGVDDARLVARIGPSTCFSALRCSHRAILWGPGAEFYPFVAGRRQFPLRPG